MWRAWRAKALKCASAMPPARASRGAASGWKSCWRAASAFTA
jgi:hypothetical protein